MAILCSTHFKPTYEILLKAILLPSKNWKLILSVFLISLLVSSILDYLLHLVEFNLVILSLVFCVVGFVVEAAMMVITIYAIAATHSSDQLLTLRELLLQNISCRLEGPLITQAYVSFLNYAYNLFWIIVQTFLVYFFSDGRRPSTVIIVIISLLDLVKVLWLIRLRTVWTLSITISVVEEGCYGIGAFKKASELLHGNRWTGYLINLLAWAMLNAPVAFYLPPPNSVPLWWMMALSFILLAVKQALYLFVLAAITVYYYQCRRNLEEDQSRAYSSPTPVTGGDHSDAAYIILPASDDDDDGGDHVSAGEVLMH